MTWLPSGRRASATLFVSRTGLAPPSSITSTFHFPSQFDEKTIRGARGEYDG
jgi:hypothetical protein